MTLSLPSRPCLLTNEKPMRIFVATGQGPLHTTNHSIDGGKVWLLRPPECRFVLDCAGKYHEHLAIPLEISNARPCFFMADSYSEQTRVLCASWRFTLNQRMKARSDEVKIVLTKSLAQFERDIWAEISRVAPLRFTASNA